MSNNWFNAQEDENRITYRPKAPFDFLEIGTSPLDGMTLETARKYDAFVNVALEPLYSQDKERPREDTEYFHVPIDEDNFWGYKPFMDTKVILDRLFKQHKKTYLHCKSGTNRSPTIGLLWIYSRVGNFMKAAEIFDNDPVSQIKRIRYYQENNYIPRELSEFYRRYRRFGPDLEKIINTEPKIKTDFQPVR